MALRRYWRPPQRSIRSADSIRAAISRACALLIVVRFTENLVLAAGVSARDLSQLGQALLPLAENGIRDNRPRWPQLPSSRRVRG